MPPLPADAVRNRRRGDLVESTEIAETISGEEAAEAAGATERFRKLTAIYLGIVAMLLAVASLGGTSAMKMMLNANIQASDTYAFYQAKYLRQTTYRLVADQLAATIATQPDLAAPAKTEIEQEIAHYRARADSLESDPQSGTGKEQLLVKARNWEKSRDRATRQDPNFDFAEALFQIAIVLGAVSIVAEARWLVKLSGAVTALAILLTVNGFFLLVELPIG
jgi:Domain of unknown function (DUF4337)